MPGNSTVPGNRWGVRAGLILGLGAILLVLGASGGLAVDGMDGAGTEDDPYRITNVSQLQAMGEDPSANYTLVSGIDASETASWNGGDGFEPIGNATAAFEGTFDGHGYAIADLTIDRSDEDGVGLFGETDYATIENVTIETATVGGEDYVGVLIGEGYETDVANVTVSGTVTATGSDVGGLMGENYYGDLVDVSAHVGVTAEEGAVGGLVGDSDDGSITNAWATGDVDGGLGSYDDVGGLVGYNDGNLTNVHASGDVYGGYDDVGGLVGYASDGTIANASAAGNVTAAVDYVGGLVGSSSYATITHARASGDVSGDWSVGGLVGDNGGPVSDAYATGAVDGTEEVGGLIGSNDADVTHAYAVGDVSGSTDVGGLIGYEGDFDSSVTESYWDTQATGRSGSEGGTGLTTAEMTGSAAAGNMTGFDFVDTWETTGEYPVLRTYEPPEHDGGDDDGDGNDDPPTEYVITDLDDLQSMADDRSGAYTLANDIDAADTAAWNGGDGFDPVGNASDPFTGSFDGNGYAIADLYLDRDRDYVGLFGYAEDATIGNVTLENATITARGLSGTLVGRHDGGSITDVATSGTVVGDRTLGGVVGSFAGELTNATADVDVSTLEEHWTTDSTIGGLAGHASGALTNVSATGDVRGDDRVGGLVGSNGASVAIASATGSVTGTGNNVGGLAGTNDARTGSNDGSIADAYATGDVDGLRYVGGLVGNNDGGAVSRTYAAGEVSVGDQYGGGLVGYHSYGTVEDGYWDVDATNQSDSDGGATGLTTDRMTGAAAATNMTAFDFVDTWRTTAGYPVLQAYQPDDGDDGNAGDGPSGDGTDGNPYVITTLDELQWMANEVDAHFVLGADVDASNATNWNGGDGFDPVGNGSEPFTGSLDGDGYEILGLRIDRRDEDDVGLFGVTDGATIADLTLANASVRGANRTATLVGTHSGDVSNVDADGSVTSDGDDVGGLIGNHVGGDIAAVSASVAVDGGDYNAGGLAGRADAGTITDAHASGDVSADRYWAAGLVGRNDGAAVAAASASGAVNAGVSGAGGLIGVNYGPVVDASATGDVESGGSQVGGLIGSNQQGSIANATAAGDVTGGPTGGSAADVGGLVGALQANSGDLTDVAAHGDVTAPADRVGGLVGVIHADASVTRVSATGDVSSIAAEVGGLIGAVDADGAVVADARSVGAVDGGASVGGLIGANDGTVVRSTADGHVVADGFYAGGLVGLDRGTITESAATGDVAGTGRVGGLVGEGSGTIASVDASGTVTGGVAKYVGGLVGHLDTGGTVEEAAAHGDVVGWHGVGGLIGNNNGDAEIVVATGSVTGLESGTSTIPANTSVGGLVGINRGPLTNAAALGDVAGGTNVGGMVGKAEAGSVSRTYAGGAVVGTDSVGGLVGLNEADVSRSVASGEVTGNETVGGLVGHHGDRWGNGEIADSYAVAAVSGDGAVGGFVGNNTAEVVRSYAAGDVGGASDVGGFAGANGGTLADAYWDENATGAATGVGGGDASGATALATEELTGPTAEAALSGFDFDGPWALTDGYPALGWEVESVTLTLADAAIDGGETTQATVDVDLVDDRAVGATTVADYASDDASVATVADDGTVSGAGAGDATITASVAGVADDAALSVDSSGGDRSPTRSGGRSRSRESALAVASIEVGTGQVAAGDAVEITVTVENGGGRIGARSVPLLVDGATIADEWVTVEPRGTAAYAVTHEFDAPGSYALAAGDAALTVRVSDAGAGSDAGDAADDGEAASVDGDREPAGGSGGEDGPEELSVSYLLVGLALAGIAIGAAFYAARVR